MASKQTSSAGAYKWSGLALVLGGVSFALFMLLHPFGELEGAEVTMRWNWVPAHTFHFLGAMFTLLGIIGLYARHDGALGRLGAIGFVIAFIGTAMFVGTGMFTAWVWPVIARHVPAFVAPGGPLFNDSSTVGFTAAPYALMTLGYILFGAAMLKAKVMPRWAVIMSMLGIVLFCVPVHPVGPVPWIVRVIGALVFGGALAWLGSALWCGKGVAQAE
ncbi:MAG: hypothetical protein FJ316_03170 [SAR202 cluster bacterium]|nr:hypothetical protein [SAR202 cluster bacterium]